MADGQEGRQGIGGQKMADGQEGRQGIGGQKRADNWTGSRKWTGSKQLTAALMKVVLSAIKNKGSKKMDRELTS